MWFENISLPVAYWVCFITLMGIVSRKGIMMFSHDIQQMKFEREVSVEKFAGEAQSAGELPQMSRIAEELNLPA